MPNASDRTTTIAKPGCLQSVRNAMCSPLDADDWFTKPLTRAREIAERRFYISKLSIDEPIHPNASQRKPARHRRVDRLVRDESQCGIERNAR